MKYSFVIPCYCSEETIRDVVGDIITTLKGRLGEDVLYQIILVNDHSKDGTFREIRQLCAADPSIIGIDLAKNFGQHCAIMAGCQYVEGDVVLFLDDDGQTDPKQMFSLIDKLEEGYDVVYGQYAEKKHSFFRNIGTKINNAMAKMLIHKPKEVSLTSYIAMRAYVVKEIVQYRNPYPYIDGLLLRTTSNITGADIEHKEREVGESGYSFGKLFALWLNGVTEFSVVPLRISILFGVLFALVGFGVGIYAIILKFVDATAPVGWSSLIAIVSFIGGVTLLMLGVIGEYIGRSYLSMNSSPQFVVREAVNGEQKTANK